MEQNNLLEKLTQRINTLLDLCDSSETPIVCTMIEDQESRQMVVDLIVKKVVQEKYDIPAAIIAIDNEFNPNALD